MKNKYISFVALAAAALATSCASDDLAEQKQEQNEPRTVTLTASVNEVQTRVGMTKGENNTASFYWHAKDAISVQTVKDGSYTGTPFSITGDNAKDGDPKATFTGNVTGTIGGYAVYPYNESHKFTGEKAMTYNLPASYNYSTVESSIFSKDGSYPSNSTNMPMLGTISGSDGNKSIKFKCLGGLAVIRIDKMPAAEGTLTVSADQQLSGNFEVANLSADEAQIATTTASDGNGKVTFTFSEASTESASVFYLPLATGNYTNLTIEITYGETTQTVSYGSLSVARKIVTAIPLYNNNGTIAKYKDKSCTISGHKFIDLGLGVLWAETNVDANSATDYGTYYSWSNATSWNAWGTECRLPTQAECNELINNCTWTWDSDKKGFKVTSKKNDNSIFLPAVGLKEDGRVQDTGSKGYYWRSGTNYGTLYFEHASYGDPKSTGIAPYDNSDNCPIRAVAKP